VLKTLSWFGIARDLRPFRRMPPGEEATS